MTEKWDPKDPDEIKDYGFDWAGTAENQGKAYGDAIVSSDWDIPSPLVMDAGKGKSHTAGVTTVWIGVGGVSGETYEITNHVVTAAGRHYDKTMKLKCKKL